MNALPRSATTILLAAAILPSATAPAAAQAGALQAGEEVRIYWDYGPQGTHSFSHTQSTIARVVDVSSTAIMLQRGGRIFTVRFSSVRGLQRRVGTRPASAPRMAVGSGLGFLGGMAIGILHAEADPRIESSGDYGLSMGVLLGAPIGALIAYATSRERGIYEDVGIVDLVSGVTMDPSGQVGLTFTLPGR